jgi:general stress protein 26
MNAPVTEIDARFSDSGAVATEWAETQRALETAELFWICTVRADGRPHVTPLVAVYLDAHVYFCTGATEQKFLNLSNNAHVILMTGANGWDTGLDVVVEGDALPVTDEDLLRELAAAWTRKWDGRWQFDVADGAFQHPGGEGAALVFVVKPAKVLAFAKGTFSHTRHRF